MSFTNTPERYGVISAAFHWLSAIIVYGMFALGLWMVTLSYYDGWYHKAPELHKSIGILLMMGLVIRVLLTLGMMMMSPVTISTPIKLILFVAMDGWTMLSKGLILQYFDLSINP